MKKKFLATLLAVCLAFSLATPTMAADFDDTNGHWGEAAIDRLADYGILNGDGSGNFSPDKQMTRAEFAQVLCNMMGYTKMAANTFTDVPSDAWFADAILLLVGAGVMNGVGGNLAAPNDPITREQAAVLLCRAMNIKPSSSASIGFKDAGSVSGWAKDAVAALTERGMINGVGGNLFAPGNNIDRASVSQLVSNMVAEYVTSNKTITGEVNGIVLVAENANVTFENAEVNAPIIVAPGAEGAKIVLSGNTTAEDVVVAADKATVTVGKDASAETVTAAADQAEVKVEGSVDSVAVEGENAKVAVSGTADSVEVAGEGAKVDVSGSVGTVSTEAANTTVAVSGTVEKVEVAEGADKTNITTTSTAKIDEVTTAADDVKVSGTGEVKNVTAEAGSVDVTTKGTEVANDGADKVTAGDKTVEAGESETVTTVPSSGGSGGGGSQTTPTGAYTITVATPDVAGGTVTANASRADEGDEVTLTVAVTDGYKLTDLTISGGTLAPAFNPERVQSSYKLTMPGANVTVTPVFAELDASKVLVTVKNVDGSTISTAEYTTGASVTFTSTPAPEGYWVSGKWLVGNATTAVSTYTITDADITARTLTITAEGLEYQSASPDIRPANGPATGSSGNFDYHNAYTQAGLGFSGGKITVNLTKSEALCAAESNVENATQIINALKQTVDHVEYLFIGLAVQAPSNATKAIIDGGTVDTAQNIPYADGGDGKDLFVDSAGNKYFIHYFGAVKADGTPLDPKDFTADKIVWLGDGDKPLRADTFTVSRGQASGGNYHTVTIPTITGGTVTATPMTAKAGDTISVSTAADEGYTIDGTITVKDASNNNVTVSSGSFTMPASNVTVTANFKKIDYTVTISEEIAGGTVTTSANNNKANKGDQITLTANPTAGYVLKSLTVKDDDNSAVTVTGSKFTMPAKNVTVTATFEAVATITVPTGNIPQSVNGGTNFTGKKAEDFQSLTGLTFAAPTGGQYTEYDYVAAPTGVLYATKFDKFGSEPTGYFGVLQLAIPTGVDTGNAVIKLNGAEKTISAPDYDAGNRTLTMIFKIDTLESAKLDNKGVSIEVDWDGAGGVASTKYLVVFKNVNPSIKAEGATALTVSTNKIDGNDDVREWNGESYICFQLKKADGTLFTIQEDNIIAAASVDSEGQLTMRNVWVTGGTAPSKPWLELAPISIAEENNEDYAHHVGMTLVQGSSAQTVKWLFVDAEGGVYSATFAVPAKTSTPTD